MSVKISELPILDSLADNDVIAGVDTSANVTSKIEMATLKNYIDTNTQYTAGTNIDITNNVISAPFVYDMTQTNALLDDWIDTIATSFENLEEETNAQIEELQSEVDSLSTIYNAFPTESGEGESLTLDDTAEVKFKKFDLKGNTSQTTYSGKNKLDLTGITTKPTSTGLTITPSFNSNNELLNIKITGTPNNTDWIVIKNISLPAGSYIMTGININDTTKTGIKIGLYIDNSRQWFIDVNNKAYNFTLNEQTSMSFVLWINNITTYPTGEIVLTPMIRLSSVSDATYEPYTNGASPNPDFPQLVNVVSGDNEINVVGKNILENTFQSQTANGITFTRNDDGSLSFSGTATQAHSITGRFTNDLVLKAGTSYTFSLGNKQAGYGVYLQQAGNVNVYYLGVSATNSSLTITPTEDTTITQLAIHFPNGNSVNGTIYPMLEVGSSASTYEPYQGNTYNVDLPVENLLPISSLASTTSNGITFTNNNDGTYTLNGTATAEATFYIFDGGNSLTANSQITFSCKEANSNIRLFWYDNWDTISGSSARIGGVSPNYTTTNNISTIAKLRINISIVNGATINNVTIKPMIQKGTKVNSFTPYGTTPIELCKIGNYQDYFYKDSGKWYLHKEITKYIFTGNETGVLQNSGKRFDITCSDNNMPICINNSAPSEISQIYCNILLASSGASTWGGNQGISYNTGTNGQILVSISGATTTQAYLNALKDNYCYYILATPIDEPVEYQPLIDQLNLLEKAMSKDGQTNISQVNNDKPFILDVTAIKSLQNVLDRIELLES